MTPVTDLLVSAVAEGKLLESARTNIETLLNGTIGEIAGKAVDELVASGNWDELNDRFFKTLAFGTGGLRGRTIGRTITAAEQGAGGPNGRPEFPCIGTATMN